MEQKQMKMWVPSFLTWRAERVLQKQAEMGYLLTAVENFGSLYTFSFERTPSLPRRFYVFRQDDIGRSGGYGRSPKQIAEEEVSPYCAEIFGMQRQLLLCGGITAGCAGRCGEQSRRKADAEHSKVSCKTFCNVVIAASDMPHCIDRNEYAMGVGKQVSRGNAYGRAADLSRCRCNN